MTYLNKINSAFRKIFLLSFGKENRHGQVDKLKGNILLVVKENRPIFLSVLETQNCFTFM